MKRVEEKVNSVSAVASARRFRSLCPHACPPLPRRAPGQFREPREIAVGGNPFAAGFDRQRGEPCILYQITGRGGSAAKRFKNAPMAFTWDNSSRVGLFEQCPAKRKSMGGQARTREYFWMRRHANDRGQHLRGNAVGWFSVNYTVQPVPIAFMLGRVTAKCVHKYVNIGQDQVRSSIRSSKAAESSRSTPGMVPPPRLQTGRDTRWRSTAFAGLAISRRSPCSISAVNVRPRFAASRLARSRRPSESRTVVRICLTIHLVCLYVNTNAHGADWRYWNKLTV